MKNGNKLFNTGLSKMLWLDNHTRRRISMIAVLVLNLLYIAPILAGDTYTVESIAAGLLAAEAKFTDLRLEYEVATRVHTKDGSNPYRVTEATYAQKIVESETMPECLRYLDRKVTMIDPKTEQSSLVTDALASFDGGATFTLDRMRKSGKPMRGIIYYGYDPNQFPRIDIDPHTGIWYFSNKLLGDLLRDSINSFRVESQSEMLEGVSTIKLVGTIWDGVGTLKLWVSPERNFLPMKLQFIRTRDGKLGSETALSSLVQLPNGMWYPKTIRLGSPDPEFAFTYNIAEISIEPIPEEFFRPAFPPQTKVYDDILKISYITY